MIGGTIHRHEDRGIPVERMEIMVGAGEEVLDGQRHSALL
jgi:hypothetical protein